MLLLPLGVCWGAGGEGGMQRGQRVVAMAVVVVLVATHSHSQSAKEHRGGGRCLATQYTHLSSPPPHRVPSVVRGQVCVQTCGPMYVPGSPNVHTVVVFVCVGTSVCPCVSVCVNRSGARTVVV